MYLLTSILSIMTKFNLRLVYIVRYSNIIRDFLFYIEYIPTI